MPEYLSPGVYIEETSFRSKTIEGLSTSTAGFIGPARFGPVLLQPELLTSLADFERIYGDGQRLDFAGVVRPNFLWHGVRGCFTEGGRRLYATRVFLRLPDPNDPTASREYTGPDETPTLVDDKFYLDGHARASLGTTSPDNGGGLDIRARYPGSGGNAAVRLILRVSKNVFSIAGGRNTVQSLIPGDVVLLLRPGEVAASYLNDPPVFVARRRSSDGSWEFAAAGVDDGAGVPLSSLVAGAAVYPLSASVGVTVPGTTEQLWDGLALDPTHTRDGAEDSLTARFRYDATRPELYREVPIVITAASDADGVTITEAVLAHATRFREEFASLATPAPADYLNTLEKLGVAELTLTGGNDGDVPAVAEYEGQADPSSPFKTGLRQFEEIEDISIVAAPGSSYSSTATSTDGPLAIAGLLIAHAETMRYRIAVLDSMNGHSVGDVRDYRAKLDSKYAALHYPWVRVLDPITRVPVNLPPSGFVAGIYARNDIERAVYKAPANEVVRLSLGFEVTLNKAQQDVLNPEGINCFRFFEGRGNRLWGARTISSDPEWKYVNLRRYFAYLEHSIDRGTQWAVFEPNGERLWGNVRRTIEDFLLNEFQNGALLGDRPERAFFVRCDRSTMTQNDLDNGRLVCLVGVAPLRPAEFVIFRIGQWTGDRKV